MANELICVGRDGAILNLSEKMIGPSGHAFRRAANDLSRTTALACLSADGPLGPQGLKPLAMWSRYGTAEAVP
jgi:hypothetical protein